MIDKRVFFNGKEVGRIEDAVLSYDRPFQRIHSLTSHKDVLIPGKETVHIEASHMVLNTDVFKEPEGQWNFGHPGTGKSRRHGFGWIAADGGFFRSAPRWEGFYITNYSRAYTNGAGSTVLEDVRFVR